MTNKKAGCTPTTLEEALTEASDICEKWGGHLTPQRKKVLAILLQAHGPVKAYDMLGQLRDDRDAKPQTIYRALDFLVEMGLVHRIASLQAFTPCQHWGHPHTAALLVCDECQTVAELDADDVMASLNIEASSVSFKPAEAVIEVHGKCPTCR